MQGLRGVIDLGLMVEGVVELDPMTGRLVVRYEDAKGAFQSCDVQEQLLRYKGEEVRCIITPMASVTKLAKMVEIGDIKLEEVPSVPKLS
jgi:hypothetical protein